MFRTTVSVVILRRRDSSFNPCLDLLDELAAQQPDNFSPFSPSLAEARDIAEEKQREPKQAGDLNLEINKEHVSQARTVVKLFDYGSRDDAPWSLGRANEAPVAEPRVLADHGSIRIIDDVGK